MERLLSSGICCSPSLDGLTPIQEVTFYRLLVAVDDYGNIDARSKYLHSQLFPTKPGVSEDDVVDALDALAKERLIGYYEVGEREYIHVTNWDRYQRIKNPKGRWPRPEDRPLPQTMLVSVEDVPTQAKSKTVAEKVKFGEYVRMTQAEYDKLVEQFGQDGTSKLVEKLDNYKGASGKKYKDDYRAILTWVVGDLKRRGELKQATENRETATYSLPTLF